MVFTCTWTWLVAFLCACVFKRVKPVKSWNHGSSWEHVHTHTHALLWHDAFLPNLSLLPNPKLDLVQWGFSRALKNHHYPKTAVYEWVRKAIAFSVMCSVGWKVEWIYSFLPGTHNKLIPRQVKGELGVVSHAGVGESRHPWTESWRQKKEREKLTKAKLGHSL